MSSKHLYWKASLLFSCALIAACSDNELEDLQAYVAEVQSRPGGDIKPLPKVKSFESFSYDVTDMRDPFQSWFITRQPKPQGDQSGPVPDTNRKKSELEQFPLDTLQAVGTIRFKGTLWALIKTPEGKTVRIKRGSRVGQDYGKVIAINDEKIVLKELVRDGMGGWQNRLTDLPFNQQQ